MEIILVNNQAPETGINFSDARFYFENIRKELYHKLADYYGKVNLKLMPNLKFDIDLERCDNPDEVREIIHNMPKNLHEWIFRSPK